MECVRLPLFDKVLYARVCVCVCVRTHDILKGLKEGLNSGTTVVG